MQFRDAVVRDGDATSARNRFAGRIVDLDRGEAVCEVTVDVGAATPIYALVTEERRSRLGLQAGREIVASFEATAIRATSR